MRQTTFTNKEQNHQQVWYHIDAKGQTLGRIADKIAVKLTGKDRADYTPWHDNGAFVIITNAAEVHVTGNKLEGKVYWHHTGFPGGIKGVPLKDLLAKKPHEVIEKAVRGMLPRNILKNSRMRRLFVYTGDQHPHSAQMPKTITDFS